MSRDPTSFRKASAIASIPQPGTNTADHAEGSTTDDDEDRELGDSDLDEDNDELQVNILSLAFLLYSQLKGPSTRCKYKKNVLATDCRTVQCCRLIRLDLMSKIAKRWVCKKQTKSCKGDLQ